MVIETPLWMQGGSFSARQDRQILALIFSEGVIDPGAGGLDVSERAAGANNSVDVAAGQVVITGDDQANQGRYLCRSTATENVVLSAAPGADARIDLIVAQVNDPDAGGAVGDSWTLVVVEGAVAAAPVAPAVPGSAVALAEVLRTNGDVAVTNAMITDVRPTSATEVFSTTSRFLRVADTAARDALSNPGEGDSVWIVDLDEIHVYNGASWEKAFPASGVDVQIFTASGSWSKPAGATRVEVYCVGGGGGGGGGAVGVGGGGGGGGAGVVYGLLASDLAASETVTVGSGGSGGAGDVNNTRAGTGGSSSFGAHLTAPGGEGGKSGDGSAVPSPAGAGGGVIVATADLSDALTGGRPPQGGAEFGGAGGGAGPFSSTTRGGGSSVFGGGGGGGGGRTGDDPGVGGSGAAAVPTKGVTTAAGAPADGTSRSGSGRGGDGGDGALAGAVGRAGGIPGGGGGGGGDDGTGFAGGAGGRGEVIVITYF